MFFAIPATMRAQAPAPRDTTPVLLTTGAFFALSVSDLEASTKWYSEKLGLSVVFQIPKQNKAAVRVLLGGGLAVELIQNDDAVPLRTAAPQVTSNILVHGIFKVGLFVEDFDRTLAILRERNVEIAFGPFPKRPHQPANVGIRDNAGNLIHIFGK